MFSQVYLVDSPNIYIFHHSKFRNFSYKMSFLHKMQEICINVLLHTYNFVGETSFKQKVLRMKRYHRKNLLLNGVVKFLDTLKVLVNLVLRLSYWAWSFAIQVVLRNIKCINSILVKNQPLTLKTSLNIPLLSGYRYHSPNQSLSVLKVFF